MKYMNSYKYKVMKRGMLVLLFLAMVPVLRLSAQNPNRERLNDYKIAFFTKRLNLTSQEAERFWPVYNEFQNKKISIQQERGSLNRTVNQNSANMSEKELTEAGDKIISLQMNEANLALEFHKKFKEILPPLKVVRLYQAENQYRLTLLNELQDRKPLKKGLN
jgi:hypothetical protein